MLLDDREWLVEQHYNQRFSAGEIAEKLGVHVSVVRGRLKKYDVPRPTEQQLREAVLFRKHGVTNPSKIPGARERANHTMDQRYGGHNFAAGINRSKFRDDLLFGKYGTVNINSLDAIKQKTAQTNIERYGYIHKNKPSFTAEQLETLNSTMSLSEVAETLGSSVSVVSRLYDVYGIEKIYHNYSIQECRLADMIRSWGVSVVRNDRTLLGNGQEIDIYCPEKKLAIEYCGTFWHSEYAGRDKNFHKNKTDLCEQLGVQLLTIFSDEWHARETQIVSKIRHLLGIDQRPVVYARNTTIVEISKQQSVDFVQRYHIQSPSNNGFVSYALVDQSNEVVAVAVLKRSRGEIIIDRYATSKRVVGGFSKLLSYILKQYNDTQVATFADRRWSNGNLYEKGIGKISVRRKALPPDYRYVEASSGQTFHKFNFRHQRIRRIFANYDSMLSEHENCIRHNYFRIWNSGMIKYTFEQKKNTN